MADSYGICARCIMDTTDPWIGFDDDGFCNHCREYEQFAAARLFTGEKGRQELGRIVDRIKAEGRGKDYDCVIGVSGGVDSTYVAYTVKQLGLRPLAVHLDNGWDSELAVHNVQVALERLGIDLFTHVLDWEEFRDIQRSFLKASVPDAEIPTDHAIGAVLFRTAIKHHVSYIISGGNLVTEAIMPLSWAYGVADWRYIRGVQKRFGTRRVKAFPHYSLADLTYFTMVRKIRSVRVLNYIPYNRETVIKVLEKELDWRYYGGKHYESIYTRFFQGYILPRKFRIDKRRAHLSTLICSGQMTRDEALRVIEDQPNPDEMEQHELEYIVKKLGLAREEFERIMCLPVKRFHDYPTYYPVLKTARKIARVGQRLGLLPPDNVGL